MPKTVNLTQFHKWAIVVPYTISQSFVAPNRSTFAVGFVFGPTLVATGRPCVNRSSSNAAPSTCLKHDKRLALNGFVNQWEQCKAGEFVGAGTCMYGSRPLSQAYPIQNRHAFQISLRLTYLSNRLQHYTQSKSYPFI